MQYIRFTVRSLDEDKTMLIARISDKLLDEFNQSAMLMFMVDTAEMAQQYFGARLLSNPFLMEKESYNNDDNLFYITFQFIDKLTKTEFEYYMIQTFLQ